MPTKTRKAAPTVSTHFLNVDLEIGSRTKLDLLVAELAPQLSELYRSTERPQHRAHYEVRRITKTVDATIREFVRVLRKLTPRAKAIWNRANVRDFNIGIESGLTPFSSEFEISPENLEAVVKLRGRIVITVYSPDLPTPRR